VLVILIIKSVILKGKL